MMTTAFMDSSCALNFRRQRKNGHLMLNSATRTRRETAGIANRAAGRFSVL